jgi:two-component system NarL family sensor kinase
MLLFSGCSTTGPVESPGDTISPGELSDFVQGAAEYAGQAGESVAIEESSKKSGSFSKGELGIYAYGFNGTLLAHPQKADDIGMDRSNWSDARGFPAIRVAAYAALTGGGYFTYLCPETAGGMTDETVRDSYIPKVGYAHAVDGEWWVGSDIYIHDLAGDGKGTLPAAVGEMIALVEEGVAYGRSHGEDDSFAEISNRSGIFLDSEGHYLYAYDYNGTLLAHPYLTDSIGDCLIEREDPFGMKMIRALSDTAESGGGFVVFIWPNPDKDNRLEQKIGYVMPVDEKWWVGSGVYLSEITGIDTSLPALPQ